MCQTLLPTSSYVHTVNYPHEEAGHREVKAFTQVTVANEGLGPRQSGSRARLLNNVSEPDRLSLGFRSFHQALGRQALARETERAAQRAGAASSSWRGKAPPGGAPSDHQAAR